MSLDWTDEAWRERWAMLARQREAERVEHQAEVDRWMAQLLAPVVVEQLRVEVPLFGYDEDGRAILGSTLYSQHAAGPDRSDHVPDPAAPDRDPG